MMLAKTAAPTASKTLARGMATGKDLTFGNQARAAMLTGVDKLADAVQVSLSFLYWTSSYLPFMPEIVRQSC